MKKLLTGDYEPANSWWNKCIRISRNVHSSNNKLIRAVPITVTKETSRHIDFLITCRKHLNIDLSKLLFAKPGSSLPFDGSKIIRDFRNTIDLKEPQFMTSTTPVQCHMLEDLMSIKMIFVIIWAMSTRHTWGITCIRCKWFKRQKLPHISFH